MRYASSLIVDQNLSLRTLEFTDITNSYEDWINDFEVIQFTEMRFKPKQTKDDIKSFITDCNSSLDTYLFGIFCENIHIGNIKIGPIDFNHNKTFISYIIGNKDFWGKGVATKVIAAIVKFSFSELKLLKIYAGLYENNIGSEKALLNNKFVKEAFFSNDINFEGSRVNSLVYGLSKNPDA